MKKTKLLITGMVLAFCVTTTAEAGPPSGKGPKTFRPDTRQETAECVTCVDELPESVCYTPSQRWEFPEAFLRVTLSGVPSGYDVSNGDYPGWCVEAFNFNLFPGADHCDTALRLTTETLPAHLQNVPWGIINYILNHKQGTARDVQNVIWFYTDSYVPPVAEQTPEYFALRNDAAGQSGFVPGPGQSVAVALDRGVYGTDQKLFIEIDCPPTNPGTGTIGYWKNHPDAWPVSVITLGGVTYSKEQAIAIMKLPIRGDKTLNMANQLIAAKLNVLIGNDSSCIADTIANADAFLAVFPIGSNLSASSTAWSTLGGELHSELDDYNNGLLCAPSRD